MRVNLLSMSHEVKEQERGKQGGKWKQSEVKYGQGRGKEVCTVVAINLRYYQFFSLF